MSLYQVLDRLDEHEPDTFVAPILTRDTTQVLTIQDNIPYWFDVRVETPGWFQCSPPQRGKAMEVEDAMPWERMQYLDQLDRFYVIALFPLDDTTWLVSPYNLGDADQRGWLAGEPRSMYLVEGTLSPLAMVAARKLGGSLIYHRTAGNLEAMYSVSPSAKHAADIVEARITELKRLEAEARRIAEKKRKEDLVAESLEHMGASLVDWTHNINGYAVTWEYNGQQHTVTLDTNLRVRSAGVCLAGTDNWHSLASIVAVMEDRASGEEFRGYLNE